MTQINPISVEAAEELLNLTSSDEVERWLREHITDDVFENDSYWRPVGDQISNAGPIEASPDEINPLVERIVNGMEAIIELKWEQAKLDSEPRSTRMAIEQLFGVPGGRARNLTSTQAQLHAGLVELVLRGNREKPTVLVRDKGIGIHPTEFSETILALNQSRKGQRPYLLGMYGQGGSSSFEKSAYTIIISRKHPDHLWGKDDEAGFTVVRRHLATRVFQYTYLVLPSRNRQVPSFPGTIAEQVGLKNGTVVAHVDYRDLGPFATQQITNRAWYTLNFRLFDPLVPWTLREERKGFPEATRTMRGVPYRLGELPRTTGMGLPRGSKGGNTSVRNHIDFSYKDDLFGEIKIEWWVLQDESISGGKRRANHSQTVEAYRDPQMRYARRRTAITRGGQTHAAQTQRLFDSLRLRHVARSTIVQVDTDDLPFESLAGFFASNRADLKSESAAAVERALRTAIETYGDDLRAIERERQSEVMQGRSAGDESAIRDRLDPMIREFFRDRSTEGHGDRGPGRHRDDDFRGREVPTFLKFANSGTLELQAGVQTHAELLTDASDRTIRGRRTAFVTESGNPVISARIRGGGNGRWSIDLIADADAAPATKGYLTARLDSQGIFLVQTETPRPLVVVPPPPPYVGNDPPRVFRLRSQSGTVHVRPGRATVSIETDAEDYLFAAAALVVETPEGITYRGHGGPRRGEIRINLDVPNNPSSNPIGTISATLSLSNGGKFSHSAPLVVDPPLGRGSSGTQERIPTYNIVNVSQFPSEEGEVGWRDMANILDIDSGWDGADVAAYTVSEDPTEDTSQRSITFYLNTDNEGLRSAEKRLVRTSMENTIDAVRQQQRTLLCYHLYQMAVNELEKADVSTALFGDDDDQPAYVRYRQEMMRINDTLLYSQREFRQALEGESESEDD